MTAALFVSAAGCVADEPVNRLGVIACHKQRVTAPGLYRYTIAEPDVVLWLGDNVYADTRDDITHIERELAALETKPEFRKLRETSAFVVTWDDHDYGLNNEGKNYPLKEASRDLHRRFWQLEDRIPENHDGVYYAQTFGTGDQRLQLIMLDGRFNRDDEGPTGDTLGERQWAWLESQLREPAALRLICSGYQVLLQADTKFETWAKFPEARQRLFDLIRDTGATGVVFVAGDQHYGEVTRIPDALGPGYDAVEFMFGGVNQYEPHVHNRHRVSPVAHAKNAYALIDIQWQEDGVKDDDADVPHVTFTCFDALTDAPELTYRLNFTELRPQSAEQASTGQP